MADVSDENEGQDIEETEEELEEALELPGADKPPLDVREISIDDIAERDNIRPAYHGIDSLAETMHLRGQLQPAVVRPAPKDAEHGKPFELIFGYRRKRAAELLREKGLEGWETIRCEVRELSEDEQIADMIIENFQRDQLSPVAEARAMMELKHSVEPPLSNAEVARKLGCDPSQVSHRLSMLMKLATPQMKRELEAQRAIGPANDETSEDAGEGPAEGEAESVEVISNDAADQAEEQGVAEDLDSASDEEEPGVDILDMVDKGEITASTAEVIASLDNRSDQEKLAGLVKRHDWGVKKASKWARDVQQHTLDEGSDVMGPIEMVEMEDVVELSSLKVKDDISEEEVDRVIAYALLRNGMDHEMLEYLEENLSVPYSGLWGYVNSLTPKQVRELTKRLAVRYVSAAHRWFDLEPELKDDLGAEDPEQSSALESLLGLPGASEMPALPEARDE